MSTRSSRPRAALSLVLAAVLATLSACGGGGEGDRAAAAAAPVAQVASLAEPTAHPADTVVASLRRRALALQAAGVPATEAARQLMDFAEAMYPQHFPGHPATAQSAPFEYRHYPSTQVYLGVAVTGGSPYTANGVYVMGGAFGNAPVYAGLLTDFITPVERRITLALGSDKAVVIQGGSSSTALTLTRLEGFIAGAQVQVDGLPAGVTARPLVVPEAGTSATLVLDADPVAPHSLPTATTVTLRAGDAVVSRALSVTVRGGAGAVDTSFGGGPVVTPVGISEDYANAVAVQPDGKVLVAGSSATNKGTQFSVVRYRRDGGLDPSFGTGGKVVLPVGTRGNDVVNAIVVQPDGRIVLAGSSEQTAAGIDMAVVSLTASGQPDASFGKGGIAVFDFLGGTDRARALLLQPDGRIVVGGEANTGNAGGLDFALLRLNTDGTLDSSFGSAGKVVTAVRSNGASEAVRALALATVAGEPRILAVGGEGDFIAVRYRADGAVDSGFGSSGKVAGLFNANIGAASGVVVQPDGKVVIAGHIGHRFAAVRLDAQGQLDTGFGTAGRFEKSLVNNWNEADALVLQADGKLVLAGWAYTGLGTSGDFAALRLTANGQLDTGFADGGVLIRPVAAGTRSDSAHAMVLQPDDRVPTVRAIVAGEAGGSNYDFALLRLWL